LHYSPTPAISALAISPNYVRDGTLFAGSLEDGVFRSSDGGRQWSAWNFGLMDLRILCLAISPNFASDEMLFVGTQKSTHSAFNGRALAIVRAGYVLGKITVKISVDGFESKDVEINVK
jgi:hypothetical protein